jgi:hypothetical protein
MLLDYTDDAHDTVALYHLAFVTDFLNRRSDFHLSQTPRLGPGPIPYAPPRALPLFISVQNPSASQVVWRDFTLNPIPRKDLNIILPDLAADLRQDFVAAFQVNAKHSVGKSSATVPSISIGFSLA